MTRVLGVLIALSLGGAYILRPVKGDNTPKQQTYVMVFYCLNAQSALRQRQSGRQKIVVGYSLPSLTPSPSEMDECRRGGGIVMTGFVQVTPPFASLDEASGTHN